MNIDANNANTTAPAYLTKNNIRRNAGSNVTLNCDVEGK